MSLLSWFFGESHSSKKRVEKIEKDVKFSLDSVRKDLHGVSKWLTHFKERHQTHDEKFDSILRRLDFIESKLLELTGHEEAYDEEDYEDEVEEEKLQKEMPKEDSKWDQLTDTQKTICWKLASIQKETPDQWISLKYLAQEIYPDKDYPKVRSALSQYISHLEEMGFVKRKRKGKQAYVYSTKENPCIKGKKKLLIAKIKRKK